MRFFTPRSRPGWWAGWFVAGAAAMMVVGPMIAGLSMRGRETPRATGWLFAVGITAWICLAGGFIASIVALAHKDRSAPVWVALALGTLGLLFVAGELAFPH